jgi:NAD(P)-dependent dehydrogenase (short-subunit alcohol dehydrogenase family)
MKTYTRSVLVTGGTTNIGFHAARDIAKAHPDYLVIIASRTDGEGAAQRINSMLNQENTIFLPLDLSDTNNVRTFAENWPSHNFPPIQALVLNAGLQFPGALQTSLQGIEKTFAISHIGHALLFHLLVPHLAPKARIVLTSSGTHDPAQKSGLPDAVYTSAEELANPPASTASATHPPSCATSSGHTPCTATSPSAQQSEVSPSQPWTRVSSRERV